MTEIQTRPPATIEDYLALPDDVRAELLCGELVMNPAPHARHQAIVGAIHAHLRVHVRSSRVGRVFISPLDVHLPTGDVVQPDVVFVATEHVSRVDAHVEGAPDLAIEVLSPHGGKTRDRVVKRDRYARSGVPEYWIVDGFERTIDVFLLEGSTYADPLVHRVGHIVTSHVLPDLRLPVAAAFEDLPEA